MPWLHAISAEDITRLPLVDSTASVTVPSNGKLYFLGFGAHEYAPTSVTGNEQETIETQQGSAIPLALFQDLHATCWTFPRRYRGQTVQLQRKAVRDPFWDQLLVVHNDYLENPPRCRLVETGEFGATLPANVREQQLSLAAVRAEQASLTDPIIPENLDREVPWRELESAAFPLDFQKILLAVPHDANPAFAYQNGQWFTTWPVYGDPTGLKEDRWFAPALAIGDQLIRPAPLSAKTEFKRVADGKLLPEWTLTWKYGKTTVSQAMLAFRPDGFRAPAVFVRFQIENPPAGCRLALGTGRRLNAHYWDDKSRERTPVPFFTLKPDCKTRQGVLLDQADRVLLASNQPFVLEHAGPLEDVLLFDLDESGSVELCTPTGEALAASGSVQVPTFANVETQFQAFWTKRLSQGAQAQLPSQEWMDRIDAWRCQVEAITRVHYQDRERLSYGAYFYQYYFGIEEAWPVIALAQWNSASEAQRQAEIMLEAENLDKTNVHHQSRNGAAPWTAAVVARLTDDVRWLTKVAPGHDRMGSLDGNSPTHETREPFRTHRGAVAAPYLWWGRPRSGN